MGLYIGNTKYCLGGITNIQDEMSNYMYVITPNGNPYATPYALLYNLEYGKSYKIILKAKNAPSGTLFLFAYQGNANSPGANTGISISAGTKIKEGVYTHAEANTFTRLGIYASTSSDRTADFACVIYIKEIE